MRLSGMQDLLNETLRTAGAEEAALAVRLFLEERLHLAPLTIPFYRDMEVDADTERLLTEDAQRLLSGEPIQYILGTQAFWDLKLNVTPAVLIPRPETEELAREAVEYLKHTEKRSVLDLCTGSGAIALAVKKHVQNADVTGSDLSEDALLVAKKNAESLGLAVTWRKSDLFNQIPESYDLIICNPPYIPRKELDVLDANVRDWEPRMALDGGEDGLCFYRRLAREVSEHLTEDGALFLEVGIGQAQEVQSMLLKQFEDVTVKKDLEGIDRMVLATGRKEETA